jgi:hypothetical protein
MKTYRHYGVLFRIEKEGNTYGYFDGPFLSGKWRFDPETKEIDMKNTVYKSGTHGEWDESQQTAIFEWFEREIACEYPPLSDVLDVECDPEGDAAEEAEDREGFSVVCPEPPRREDTRRHEKRTQ